MARKRPLQKLVSFMDNKTDFNRITDDMKEGWAIISLIQNGNYYVGIMEKMPYKDLPADQEVKVYIPPRKKVSICYST